jgi:hypothetical protein
MMKKKPVKKQLPTPVPVPEPVTPPAEEWTHTLSCDDPPIYGTNTPDPPREPPAAPTLPPPDPPLVEVLGSQLRAKQQELDLMTARWHAAEARLFDATAEARKQQVEADNQAMLERLEAAAPTGFTWNTAAGRYVPK